jgi:predicted RNA-binding protein (virulence factor B family)
MLYLGKMNSLRVLRDTVHGMFLGGEEDDQDVLLPRKYVPADLRVDDLIDVFLYTDSEDRLVATTRIPKIQLQEITVLTVKDVMNFGAFLDWGLDKDLFLPLSEQKKKVAVGDKVTVCLLLDDRTDRLYATAKVKNRMKKEMTVEEGEEVELQIERKTELGYSVIINNIHEGLIFFNKVFQPLHTGDRIKGFIENIRNDGKITVCLQKRGYAHVVDKQDIVLEKLKGNHGILYLTDKSDPEEIIKELLISKSVFKKCIGALYKQKKIKIEDDRIVLLS